MRIARFLPIAITCLALAQTHERLTFEIASIKPAKADRQSGGIKALPGGQRYQAQNVPVKLIMSLMYKIPARQIQGAPAWMDNDRWDIEAKAAHPDNLDNLHTMFQNLLVDEFKLKFHIDPKEGAVYALMVDRSGLKMKQNDSAQDFEIPIQGNPTGEIVGKRVPMEYLTWWLSQVLSRDGRPVLDQTGLDKFYDFKLSYSPELPPGVDVDKLPAGMMDRPNIFVALREQLGLHLEAKKGPVPIYVIDSIQKPETN